MEKKSAGTAGTITPEAINGTGPVRTTVLFPAPLSVNLELFALKTREPKGEVIRKALTEYLDKHGFDSSRLPEITYRWREKHG